MAHRAEEPVGGGRGAPSGGAPPAGGPCVLVDAHVHLHPCCEPGGFFDSAWANFAAAARKIGAGAWHGFLLFTESSGTDAFGRLAAAAGEQGGRGGSPAGAWRVERSAEPNALLLRRDERQAIRVVAGRQVVTAERLEVLALFVAEAIDDGGPVREVIGRVVELGGLPVVPWGFGKWSGRRGALVRALLAEAAPGAFMLGDNGGRPGFLPPPGLFAEARRRGIRVLPGSDPLPFAAQCRRPGAFGCWFPGEPAAGRPAEALRRALADPAAGLRPYGRPEGIFNFVRNQVKMQLWKRGWIAS